MWTFHVASSHLEICNCVVNYAEKPVVKLVVRKTSSGPPSLELPRAFL